MDDRAHGRERQIVDADEARQLLAAFRGRAARVCGGPGTGKTTALVARALHLAAEGERAIVVTTPSGRAAVADAVVRADPIASPLLRVASWTGLARSVVAAEQPEVRYLDAPAKRELIASLLARDVDSFAVARSVSAIDALRSSWLGRDEILTHADAAGALPTWEELWALCERFEHHLRTDDLADEVSMLIRATLVLREPDARRRLDYQHVLVDDIESATFAQERLLFTIASPADHHLRSLVVAGDPEGPVWSGRWGAPLLSRAHRAFDAELDIELRPSPSVRANVEPVRVHHRAVVGEAVIGEVARLLDDGMRADDIAVIADSVAVEAAVAAAARRHGIGIGSTRRRCGDDPVVAGVAAAILDPALATGKALPSELAFAEWTRLAATLLASDATSFDAVHPSVAGLRAFIDALAEHERALGQHRLDASTRTGIVTAALNARTAPGHGIAVIGDQSTRGRRWQAVIVTGCEEGVRPPRPIAAAPLLDLELVNGPDVPDPTERQARTLIEARRRFEFLHSRASTSFIAISAPEPGVLVSRFLEPVRDRFRAPYLPRREQRVLAAVPETANDAPLWTGPLRVSASSLETYLNCPLQFTLRYVLGVDTPSGVQAAVGTLVHAVLERFLDPNDPVPRTRACLEQLLDEAWRDDLFTYRAQAVEFRARVTKMLLSTWFEGEAPRATDVAKVEHHFRIEVAGHTLSGIIDRIDRHVRPDGRAELEIIDYKTGSWKNARAGEESLQLGVYYLAAKRDPELTALGEPTRLRLHFVDAGKDAEQRVTTNHEALWETVIAGVLRDIETQDWQPSDEADCEYCDFQRICPNQPQGRVVPLAPPRRGAS